MEIPHCRLGLGSSSMTRILQYTSVLLLWFTYTAIATTTTPSDTATATEPTGPSKSASSAGVDWKTVLTLGVTFPVGLMVGVAWCFCMSKVCGTDQRPPKARLNQSLTRTQRLQPTDFFDE